MCFMLMNESGLVFLLQCKLAQDISNIFNNIYILDNRILLLLPITWFWKGAKSWLSAAGDTHKNGIIMQPIPYICLRRFITKII
jgi:hypothetical protein